MNVFSAVLVVVPWYVSLIVFWVREQLPFDGVLRSLFSTQTIILTVFFLVFLPFVAIYVNARWGAKRKRQHEELYLFLTAFVGVALGIVGSDFWVQNASNNNSLVFVMGLVVLLVWKFIWDFRPRKL